MNIEPIRLKPTGQFQSAIIAHDGLVVSHDQDDSTFCAGFKHILSLDEQWSDLQRANVHIGDRIAIARKAKGYSQGELGDAIGKGQTTISSWERGRTEPTRDDVQAIADLFRIPASDIEGLEGERQQLRFREIPILSWVSAGRLSEPSELNNPALLRGEKLLLPDLPGGEYFSTVVVGDSMDRISPEGSRIVVNVADRDPRPGRYYVFSLRGETTFKRFQSDPVIRLEPFSTNPANQIIFPKADKDWMVIGRVVRSYIDLD